MMAELNDTRSTYREEKGKRLNQYRHPKRKPRHTEMLKNIGIRLDRIMKKSKN